MTEALRVEVRWARVVAGASSAETDLTWLSDEERARAARFRFDRDRDEYVTAHRLLRRLLGGRLGLDPGALRFAVGEHGRPELAVPGAPLLRFNLSHTRGLVAVAMCDEDCELGVDVEDHTRPGPTVELADRYFAPVEARELRALPEDARRARFFALWTLKEAYIKARGLGLSMPLEQFAFRLDARGELVGFEVDPGVADEAARWRFHRAAPTTSHALAVAVAPPPGASASGVAARFTVRPEY